MRCGVFRSYPLKVNKTDVNVMVRARELVDMKKLLPKENEAFVSESR